MSDDQDSGAERPRFKTIEANWRHFNDVDIAKAAPELQRSEMYRAFMAGAGSALMLAIDAHTYGDFRTEAVKLFAELGSYLAIADARRRRSRAAPADDGSNEVMADVAEAIVERCRPHLAGQHAAIQGAALADLLATWIAGHDPEVRDKVLGIHIDGVRALIPHNDPRQHE
jgi:hypothetical protein